MASRTDRADNRRQDVAVKRAAESARGQRQRLAHIIGTFAPDDRGEPLDRGPGQLRECTRFGWFESEGATDGKRVSEEGCAKRGVGEQTRQDRLDIG